MSRSRSRSNNEFLVVRVTIRRPFDLSDLFDVGTGTAVLPRMIYMVVDRTLYIVVLTTTTTTTTTHSPSHQATMQINEGICELILAQLWDLHAHTCAKD